MEVVDFAKLLTNDSNQVHPVILSAVRAPRCGLSRATFPKQLLPLVSEQTLLQEAVARTSSDAMFTTPIVICNEDHRFLVDEQLKRNWGYPRCAF